ncbi:pilus assembly protein PilN [Vibrio zhanjiangensis]|uniref:Pilus assembly protein PilN n=1 Tax=Vibrio zhanjiangensis TaxID=1046128 RepID=A0ABQ6EZK0_9VIBR|nr:PilN domain-containing protein [Vibrio zhanjiangensis]GLT17892.1 pilus assembly protein PilN [Vibrio zhanjiangensis]
MGYNVNLIPWRQKRTSYLKRRLIVCLATITLIAAVTTFYITDYLVLQLEIQQERVAQINQEIDFISCQKQKVNHLQQSVDSVKSNIVHLAKQDARRFNPLILMFLMAKEMPEDVYLNQINLTGEQVEVQGVAATVSGIDALLTRLNHSGLVDAAFMRQLNTYGEGLQRDYPSFSILFVLSETLYE